MKHSVVFIEIGLKMYKVIVDVVELGTVKRDQLDAT